MWYKQAATVAEAVKTGSSGGHFELTPAI